jgi:hypothetical protein
MKVLEEKKSRAGLCNNKIKQRVRLSGQVFRHNAMLLQPVSDTPGKKRDTFPEICFSGRLQEAHYPLFFR